MRMPMIAAGCAALLAADGAGAQRMVMAGPGTGPNMAHVDSRYVGTAGSRWGSRVDGHWWAGMNAPGGWGAYRRPHRGWTLPGYWLAADYGIGDWATYGLGAPPAGYGWTRYYDDAVLIDGSGRVYDSVSGVDWDRGDGYYAADAGVTYSQPTPYAANGYAPAPQPAYAPGYAPGAAYAPPPAYVEQRNSGVGGALIGAAVGAGAGYAIGGRGNRVAGSLIGAGVGGAAGYAIDRSQYHRVPVAPRDGFAGPPPGAGYPPPPPPPPPPGGAYAPPPPPAGGVWRSPDGGTLITTTSAGGYYGGSTTTITVQTAPVVTTTTTEIVEDRVTYTRHHPVRHKWVRRAPVCYCR